MTSSPAYVPSANKAIPDGCPDRLAVVAKLFGLESTPPEACRVLEIGCAEGVHLAALATLFPESRHLGIDLDQRAVEKGNETLSALALDNATLECSDFREFGRTDERFDFVVAHGIYSWVTAEARDALLSVIHRVLGDKGVAYVSFNALPGGHARAMLRDLLLPVLRSLEGPRERISRARQIVRELLRESAPPGARLSALREELEHFSRASDSLVHHDYLAETNESVGLATFVEHLDRHGLEYVADAQTLDCSTFVEHPLVKALDASDQSRFERLATIDRLEMRRFRQAVVCRKGASSARLDFGRAEKLWFASSAEPSARGAVRGAGPARFNTIAGLELETTVPEIKAALYELGRVWPAALGLSDLAERVGEHAAASVTAAALARFLLDSGASAAVRAFARAPRSVHAASARPAATPLARLEATGGGDVTNLHHTPVTVEPAFNRHLLALLDGARDRAELVRTLADEIEKGTLTVPGIDPSVRSRWEGLLGREVDGGLERLARYALLVA